MAGWGGVDQAVDRDAGLQLFLHAGRVAAVFLQTVAAGTAALDA
jgi:hypothetical protein